MLHNCSNFEVPSFTSSNDRLPKQQKFRPNKVLMYWQRKAASLQPLNKWPWLTWDIPPNFIMGQQMPPKLTTHLPNLYMVLFLGPTRVHMPNGILIGSVIFNTAHVCDQQTQTRTHTHTHTTLCSNKPRIHALLVRDMAWPAVVLQRMTHTSWQWWARVN